MYSVTGIFTALCLALSLCVTTGETIDSRNFTISSKSPPSFQAPSPNAPAAHILPLTRKAGVPQGAGYLQSLRKGNHVNGVYGLTPVNSVLGGLAFVADIEFGTQSFQAVIDTGSSDTWLVGKGFQCIDQTTGAHVPESACMFGPTYTISPTFKRIPNEDFNTSYADNSTVTGIFGNETVTIAGIPIQEQQIGVVDHATYVSDNVSSGLMGLAFPDLTQAFAETSKKSITYSPVLTNLFSKGYVAPLFSLAIERSSTSSEFAAGGLLAIGGLPPVRFSPTFATAPFQLLTVNDPNDPIATIPRYSFYTIITNGFTYQRSQETLPNVPNPFGPPTKKLRYHVIVDSGTSLILLPTAIANAVNALFDPPAVYDPYAGSYAVNCSAKAPEFGVEIGEQTFFVNGQDLIYPGSDGNEICFSGINDAVYGMSVLGGLFLKNVLAVFDVGASEMRFAAREFY